MSKLKQKHSAPDRRDPIDILLHEHSIALQYLHQLGDATEQIRVNGFSYDAFQKIEEALQFINLEIRHHNEKEERYLFPLLERHTQTQPTAMREEHRELWKALDRVQECIKDVEESRIYSNTIRELIRCCTSILTMLNNHIANENTVLFPMAKKLLTREEYQQLQQDICSATPLLK
jgi:hemerythrin-like domain-containing protein